MKLISATDLAIALAHKGDTLRLLECDGRYGPYVAMLDSVGLIEVQPTLAAAYQRIVDCTT